MVRWVVGSILHGVDPLSYFSFQPVLHDWCNKGCSMCYPVCGIVHIKEPLLLIGKSSPCGGSGFPLSLSEWSFTICPTPYNRKIKCVECFWIGEPYNIGHMVKFITAGMGGWLNKITFCHTHLLLHKPYKALKKQ